MPKTVTAVFRKVKMDRPTIGGEVSPEWLILTHLNEATGLRDGAPDWVVYKCAQAHHSDGATVVAFLTVGDEDLDNAIKYLRAVAKTTGIQPSVTVTDVEMVQFGTEQDNY